MLSLACMANVGFSFTECWEFSKSRVKVNTRGVNKWWAGFIKKVVLTSGSGFLKKNHKSQITNHKSKNHWSQLFQNVKEPVVLMKEPIKNSWFSGRLFECVFLRTLVIYQNWVINLFFGWFIFWDNCGKKNDKFCLQTCLTPNSKCS
jgi:hypothetical protein